MNRTPEQKFGLLFEAMKRSLMVVDRLHTRLWHCLEHQIEPAIHKGEDVGSRAVDPMIDSISLIDFLHRFTTLADALPMIRKRAPEMQRLAQAMLDVEAARHYLQHTRGDLSTNLGISYPILGAILWSRLGNSYAMQFSQAAEETVVVRHHVARVGVHPPKMLFRCKEILVDLDLAISNSKEAYAWIAAQIESSDPDFTKLVWGSTLIGKVVQNPPHA